MLETSLFQSATDAAQAVRRKEISSRELTEMLLTRIEEVNPALNAVVELRREAALREAAAADEAIARGDVAGALHGVPMTIKDSFNVAGLHTTWGNPAFKDFVADSDATVVRRLKRGRRDHRREDQRGLHAGRLRADSKRTLRRHQQSVGHHTHTGRLHRRKCRCACLPGWRCSNTDRT